MTDIIDRLNDSLSAGYSELRKEAAVEIMRLRNAYYALLQERDNLHAKIEAMEEQKPMDSNYTELLDSAQKIVESYVYFRRDVAGTPLENDIAIWMVDFVLAQPAPSVPEGWLRAIDEALVVAHVGVANEIDTYEQAKAKLDSLIGFHVDVATDPDVNGGWKLAPIVSTDEMDKAGANHTDGYLSTAQMVWDAMLTAAPEFKP